MMNLARRVCFLALFLVCAITVCGAEVTLKVGDPAPPLYLEKFVKGDEVKSLEKGKVYVIECWATWCGPCVAAMPHVSELQKKYADQGVVVIGTNVWERNLALVEPFVKKQGERMGYRVAMEQREEGQPKGKMASEWLTAAGRNGIPCSFIVDKAGKIAWIGHPVAMDKPLEKIVAGTFDPEQQAKDDAAVEQLQKQYSEAARAKDYDKAIAAIDEILTYQPGMALYMQGAKLNFLYKKGDYAAGNALANKIASTDVAKDNMRAAGLAFAMLNAPEPEKIDTDLAMKVAKQAADYMVGEPNGGDVAANSLLAQAYAAKKDYAKAVEYQQKAVDGSKLDAQKAAAKRKLEEYKEKAQKSPPAG
jgi:thiol-disulfide isomerase/thioredoxin